MPLSRITFLVLALLTSSLSVYGSGGDRVPGSRYVSGRGAALGDAYIGLADTVADSLFYNPAGLGRVSGFSFEPLNLQIQTNSKFSQGLGQDFYQFQDLGSYKDHLNSNPGTNPGASYAALPAFGFRGFGVGALYQSRLMAESNGTDIRYRTVKQFIPSAGFGLRLASGVLRMGYVLQWVNQVSGDRTVASTSSPLGWTEGVSEGRGFSHNFGMALTLPYQQQPSINVVARNIGGLALKGKPLLLSANNPSGSIPEEKMSLDASFGFLVKAGGRWSLSPQFVLRDALNSSDAAMVRRFSVGLEVAAADRFFLRGGMGSGYPSAGLGLRTSRAEANFAWWSEDLGTRAQPARDVRYLFQFLFKVF